MMSFAESHDFSGEAKMKFHFDNGLYYVLGSIPNHEDLRSGNGTDSVCSSDRSA